MRALLGFGDNLPGYDVPVLNEREARAGAGILFAISLIAFMNAFLVGNFAPIRVVAAVFFIDFFIRVLISPKFAPSLVLGRMMVQPDAGIRRRPAEAFRMGARSGAGHRHGRAGRRVRRARTDQHADLRNLPDAALFRNRIRNLHRLRSLPRGAAPGDRVMPGRRM
ncbi:MAG: DUF4395 family protein [Xanthobacteraceae bacterium]|nr:DUF4395 family protein [Xanthobacteraceae bacterium]